MSTLADVTKGYELPADAPEQERRLALARWLVAADNPLTPRVLVNRLWQYHFGTGIVATPSDFGYMGERPTHPELLDWLAKRLVADGWRLKPLHKLIVMSQTYRQSSAYREDAAKVDADSRLLWRFPPRRLSAEEIRDTMLFVAGKLDEHMGGPGFRLYQYSRDNVATYTPLETFRPGNVSPGGVSPECPCVAGRFALRFRRAGLRVFGVAANSDDDAVASAGADESQFHDGDGRGVRRAADEGSRRRTTRRHRSSWRSSWRLGGSRMPTSRRRQRRSSSNTACGRFAGRC